MPELPGVPIGDLVGDVLKLAREKALPTIKEIVGNIWTHWREPDTWIGVPTHLDRRVGTGVFSQLEERAPGTAAKYAMPDAPDVMPIPSERVVLLPTVPKGKEVADPELIKQSLQAVKQAMDSGKVKKLVIPELGTGQGGLQPSKIKPIIEQILGGRDVTVVKADKSVADKMLHKTAEAGAAEAPAISTLVGAEITPPKPAVMPKPEPQAPRAPLKGKLEAPPLAEADIREQFSRLAKEIEAAQARQQAEKQGGVSLEERDKGLAAIQQQVSKITGLRGWAERSLAAGKYKSREGNIVVVDNTERVKLQDYIKKQNRALAGLVEKSHTIKSALGERAISPDIKWDWISPDKGRPYLKLVDPTGEFNTKKLRAEFGRIKWDPGYKKSTTGEWVRDKSFEEGEVRGYLPMQTTLPTIRVSVPEEFHVAKEGSQVGEGQVKSLLKDAGTYGQEIYSRLRKLDPDAPASRLVNEANYFSKLLGNAPLEDYRRAESSAIAGIGAQLNKELQGTMQFENVPNLWQNARYPDYIRFMEMLRGKRLPLTSVEGQGARRVDELLGHAGYVFNKLGEEGPFEVTSGKQDVVRKWVEEKYVQPKIDKMANMLVDLADQAAAAGDPAAANKVLDDAFEALVREAPENKSAIQKQVLNLTWNPDNPLETLEQLRQGVSDRAAQQLIQQGGKFPLNVLVPYFHPRSGLRSAYVHISGLPGLAPGELSERRLSQAIREALGPWGKDNWVVEQPHQPLPTAIRSRLLRELPNFVVDQPMKEGLAERLYPGVVREGKISGEGVTYNNNAVVLEKLRPLQAQIEDIAAKIAEQRSYDVPLKNDKGQPIQISPTWLKGIANNAREMVHEIFDAADKGLRHFTPLGRGVEEFSKASAYRKTALGVFSKPWHISPGAIEGTATGLPSLNAPALELAPEWGGDPIDLLYQILRRGPEVGIEAEPVRSGIRRVGVGSVEQMGQNIRLPGIEFEAQAKTLVGTPQHASRQAFLEAFGGEKPKPLSKIFPTQTGMRQIAERITTEPLETTVHGTRLVGGEEQLLKREKAVRAGRPIKPLMHEPAAITGQMSGIGAYDYAVRAESDRAKAVVNLVFSTDSPDLDTESLHKHLSGLFNRWFVTRGEPVKFELGQQAYEVGVPITPVLDPRFAGPKDVVIPGVAGPASTPGLPDVVAIKKPDTERISGAAANYFEKRLTNFVDNELKAAEKFGTPRREFLLNRLDQLSEAMQETKLELNNNRAIQLLNRSLRVVDEQATKLREFVYKPITERALPQVSEQAIKADGIAESFQDELTGPVKDPDRVGLLDALKQALEDESGATNIFTRLGRKSEAQKMARKAVSDMPEGGLISGLKDLGAGLYRLPQKVARNHPIAKQLLDAGWKFSSNKVSLMRDYREEAYRIIGGQSLQDRWKIGQALEGKIPMAQLDPGLQIVATRFRDFLDGMAEYVGVRAKVNDTVTRDFFGRPEKYVVKSYLPNDVVEVEGYAPVAGRTNWSLQTFQKTMAEVNPGYRKNYMMHTFKGQWAVFHSNYYESSDPLQRQASMAYFDDMDSAIQHVLTNVDWQLPNGSSLLQLYNDKAYGPAWVEKYLEDKGVRVFPRINMPADVQLVLSVKGLGRLSNDLKNEFKAVVEGELQARGFSQQVVQDAAKGITGKDVFQALLQEIGISPKKRFIAAKQSRELNLQNYVKDPLEAIELYIRSAVTGVEGTQWRKDSLAYLQDLHKEASANLDNPRIRQTYEYMRGWAEAIETSKPSFEERLMDDMITYVGGRRGWWYRRALSRASGLMSITKLGNPMSALVNLSQTAINTYPVLGNATFTGMKLALQRATNPRALFNGHYVEQLAKELDIELYIPKWAIDSFSASKSRRLSYISLYLFNQAERVNRAVAAFGAYAKAIEKGMTHERAVTMAKAIEDRTQFRYGVEALPGLFRNPTARFFLQFKPFLINELNFVGDLFSKHPDIARFDSNKKELTRFMLAGTAMAGLLGLPFVEKLDSIMFDNTGFSFIDELKKMKPELVGQVSLRGIGALMGLDLTQRIGIPDIENLSEIFFNPQISSKQIWHTASVWTGLIYDVYTAAQQFMYYRDEIRADNLFHAIAPVQLWSLYQAAKSATGKTPTLQGLKDSTYWKQGELRSPARAGAKIIELPKEQRNYALILKAMGGRLPAESAASEDYQRFLDVTGGWKQGADRARAHYLQLLNSGKFTDAASFAIEAANTYKLKASDFAQEQANWDMTLRERAAKSTPKSLRPDIYQRFEQSEPGFKRPVTKKRKAWH